MIINGDLGVTYVYSYDNGGNILFRKAYSYTAEGATPTTLLSAKYQSYSTSEWGDLLVGYGNAQNPATSFTYDEIGNPTVYYNGSTYNFEWEGRQLVSADLGWGEFTYSYDADGRLIRKVDPYSMITEYFYDGDLLIAEVYEAEMFVYFYDESGSPMGFGYHDSMSYSEGYFDLFWFEKSMFGDILAVYDEYGNKKVSYSYDAWGNQRTTYHGSDYYIASRNPFRYRGYYYDAELGMYRLQTRYYDSKYISYYMEKSPRCSP